MNKKYTKILLVDDEPDIIEIVSYNLKNAGYHVFTAKNGKEAILQAEKHLPHLIILDVMVFPNKVHVISFPLILYLSA